MDQSECGYVRWNNRLENAWFVPRLSAIIRAVCELGVLQMVQYMVQAVEHGPKNEPALDHDVGRLKLKRTRLEAIASWSREALKVGPKEFLPLGKIHLWFRFFGA